MSNDICRTSDLDREICPHCNPQPEPEPAAPTKPGLYPGIPESVYHGDLDSLSSTAARRLLDVSPRQWKWERDNPKPKSADYFDLGTAVHTLVLGTGPQLVDLGVDEIRKDDVKAEVKRIRAEGGTPLRSKHYRQAHDMAEAVTANPTVADWLASGEPELSLWHRDPVTGVMLRTRADWVHWLGRDSALIVDLKTSSEPGPEEFRRSVRNYRYHVQQAWYQGAFAEHGITTAFVFVVVCEAPPHVSYIVELTPEAVDLGERTARRAVDIYAACLADDVWPAHGTDIHHIDLPHWAYQQEEYAQ